MRSALRGIAVTALCAVTWLSAVAPATAATAATATAGRIKSIGYGDGQLKVNFGVNGGTSGAKFDVGSIGLSLDGRALKPAVTDANGGRSPAKRTVVLVIDTSRSMLGSKLDGAKQAAEDFLNAVPADVQVGLVAFSDKAVVKQQLTPEHPLVGLAVQQLQAEGGTALYDGVQEGLKLLGSTGIRLLVVLSDGDDSGSTIRPAILLARAKTSKTTIDAIGFQANTQRSRDHLQEIAQAGDGQLIQAAAADDLPTLFKDEATTLSNQVVISAEVPPELANHQVTVLVTGSYGATAVRDSAEYVIGAAKAPSRSPSSAPAAGLKPVDDAAARLATKDVFYVATGAIFLGLLVLLALLLRRPPDSTDAPIRRRLSIYTLSGRAAQEATQETSVLGGNALSRTAVDFAGRVVRQRNFETNLARRLEAAGVPLKPAEWLLIHLGVAVGVPLLALLLTGGDLLICVIGLVVGVLLPLAYLSFKEGKRTAAFLNQLPDTLQLVAGSLSAGYSLPQAIDSVVREGAEPIAGEFRRALIDARLGVPLEDSLEAVAERMKSKDFTWIVMAVRIQREVGGNLAEVLTTVAATLRDRDRIRRQVSALSAEGRLSAAILFSLPVVFAMYLLLVRRAYIRVLYTDPLGIAMLVVMLILLGVGGLWLRAVVRVEV